MSKKTNEQIEQFIWDALAPLLSKEQGAGTISGDLYPEDCRPLDSKLEDAVIAVSNGFPGQVQSGRARLNIYVPDIDCGYGRKVKNKGRLEELSRLDTVIVDMLNASDTDYLWGLFATTATIAAADIEQHFVNINLEFNCVTFND